jgi:hypothetical protein
MREPCLLMALFIGCPNAAKRYLTYWESSGRDRSAPNPTSMTLKQERAACGWRQFCEAVLAIPFSTGVKSVICL